MSETTKKQFDELKAKHPDAVLLFHVGDFYECYMDDAKTVSDVLGLTLTRVDSTFHYKEPAYMCGFPHHALDSYLPKLVRAGVRVALCDQLKEPPAKEPTTSQTLNPTRDMEKKNEIKNVPISAIQPSPRNPRKNFDEESLQELADNIKQQGLLQPITVRPIVDLLDQEGDLCKYEVVCGERRFRAVKMNGDETIPCIVRDLDDETAYEVMITENLQRKDIDPMEEAFAFAELVKVGKSADEIALRFGKPLRFVQARIKLATLIPEAKELVTEGTMDIGCAQIICKLTEEEQKGFLERYKNYGAYTKGYARNYVDGLFNIIENADFEEDFTGSCGIKCSECQFNSSNAGCLFYEMKQPGKCTQADKFKEKLRSWYRHVIDKERDVLLLEHEDFVPDGTCIVVESRYNNGDTLKNFVQPYIDDGFKVVERDSMFGYGDIIEMDLEEDEIEEIKKLKEEGTGYRCVLVRSWYGKEIDVDVAWLRFKTDPKEVDPNAVEVAKLVNKLRGLKSKRAEATTEALCELIKEDEHRNSQEQLFGVEEKVICTLMLNSLDYIEQCDLGVKHFERTELQVVEENMKSLSNRFLRMIARRYITHALSNRYSSTNVRNSLLEMLAEAWNPAGRVEAKDKVNKRYAKRIADIESQLTALGYDTEGKKLDF